MEGRFLKMLVLGSAVIGTSIYVLSQVPAPRAKNGLVVTSQTSHPKPTNLTVLPKNFSGDEVDQLMHRYEQEVGAPCGFCHVENTQTKEIDYASDENPIKQTARLMIGMTADINAKYLSQTWRPALCGTPNMRELPSGADQAHF